jgi:outer membrane protein TolC
MRSRNLHLILTVLPAVMCPMFLIARQPPDPPAKLSLTQLVDGVYSQYPPYLAALIERDVAQGKLRSARGIFDFQTFVDIFDNTQGFYEATTVEAGFEQFTGLWGSTIYGGYRYTEGFLPDYYYERRTNAGGQPEVGIKLPLLQNRAIDERRATLLKAKLEKEQADPKIRKQQLDFTKAAMFAYYNWHAEVRKLAAAEEILRIAQDRAKAVKTQIERGLVAPVIEVENNQMVISRELALLKAQRAFEAASIALSLFHRNDLGEPIIAGRALAPDRLPEPFPLPDDVTTGAIAFALEHRPELAYLEIELQKLGVDARLFRNKALPKLDTFVGANQGAGAFRYKDTGDFELKTGLQFRVPLQRNEAKGKQEENAAKTEQTQNEYRFAMDRISAELHNAFSAVTLALDQVQRARQNTDLALQLQKVEQDRFELGATDLLGLMIREQAAFQARVDEIESLNQYYKAISDFITSTGIKLNETAAAPPAIREAVNALDLEGL